MLLETMGRQEEINTDMCALGIQCGKCSSLLGNGASSQRHTEFLAMSWLVSDYRKDVDTC